MVVAAQPSSAECFNILSLSCVLWLTPPTSLRSIFYKVIFSHTWHCVLMRVSAVVICRAFKFNASCKCFHWGWSFYAERKCWYSRYYSQISEFLFCFTLQCSHPVKCVWPVDPRNDSKRRKLNLILIFFADVLHFLPVRLFAVPDDRVTTICTK